MTEIKRYKSAIRIRTIRIRIRINCTQGPVSSPLFATPEGFIKKLENVMYSFTWNSTDIIKRKILIAETEYGGLKMVDIESQIHAIKGAWVQKKIKSRSDWSIFVHNYIIWTKQYFG